MQLTGVELVTVDVPFRQAIDTAMGSHRTRSVLFVRVVGDLGEGWGECAALGEATSVDPAVAEVAAAALQGDKRASLVGERTYGDASVLRPITMDDGSAIILSVAKYSTPLGKKIQDEAVTPNVVVAANQDNDDQTGAQKTPKPDDQLTKALDILKQKNS